MRVLSLLPVSSLAQKKALVGAVTHIIQSKSTLKCYGDTFAVAAAAFDAGFLACSFGIAAGFDFFEAAA